MERPPVLRVLVIDPDLLRQQVLQEILHGLDTDCMTASTGSEGLWKLCAGRYDVVAIAETLPDMTGALAARVLRDGGDHQPIVFGLTDDAQARQAFLAAGADDVLEARPDLAYWRSVLRLVDPRVDRGRALDRAALDAWRDYQGQDTWLAVVEDYLAAGSATMVQLRQAIARADADTARRAARIFGSHSRVVGAGALARACEDLEAAFVRQDLKAASGHLLRVQDDWLRVRAALEPEPLRLAG